MKNLQNMGLLVLAAAIPLIAVLPLPDFWITQLNYIGMYSMTVLGLVLLTGVGGLTSFGQAAFVGIGAYTTAWLTLNTGMSPWLTLFVGMGLTAGSALLVGLITLRMSGHYLPLATIAWGLSLYYLMGNLDALGKYDGLLGIKSLSIGEFDIGQGRAFFVLTWVLLLAFAAALLHLLDSRAGRAIRALKGGSQMAEAMGISTFRYKVTIFVLAALFASVAGWLLAHFQRTVNPSAFGLKMGIEYLFMAVVGGVGHVWGAIVGAGLIRVLEDQLQVLLPKLMGTSGSYEVIVFGIALVMVLKYLPDGLWSLVGRHLPKRPRPVDWQHAAALPERDKPETGALVLDVRKARMQFGGLVAVNDISFQIRAGQIVGLIGPNGAGKSTTFNLITGVLRATSGEVDFRGAPISGLNSRNIARQGMARTFQHVKMIPDMTVLENVALGTHTRGRKGVLSAMLRANRTEEQQLFREAQRQLERIGMGEYLHEQAGNLAMGPQRLMEIARALCADPALLLLDEPAAGLRHQEKQALAGVLRQLKSEGMSILLVEHDMDLVMQICDHLVVMEFGTLLTQGPPAQIQQDPKVRAAYLGTDH
ncbi:MAG: branched-chain amino acid ABC transporter ATP-binding protein/permease [Hydrogenophaga sp.]|jgi:branched-chain amino acid transport system permease protein|uniref:branched-chain amino acid ABC transporter ATP-binding protein/permease n=1 Tax=Hydrogenophaga sp. TaxID=1904254 RepID=UPI0027184D90|nr:branched-chain amino acid ABC transporter ATP-binding protein/permease [Hydrogenophaga sp.]MDO9479217.1 branched-chain amino acid ABC transporter ATP-binding protein/permease [Hydrogenophaga sp.]MDO9570073.1 branched-chain amino acid ABC transporter ATP-binding protein/permease [Hydrogenophaga sp.]MDP1895875.1 branched-chain amino acid ABC transporter ATP-binding protein/permease [Hydrogenophaga sp.]MDP3346781.1 branched-chain amino acid ABC transporter ATP-binding protein/permease [Hydrogen